MSYTIALTRHKQQQQQQPREHIMYEGLDQLYTSRGPMVLKCSNDKND